MIGAKGGHLAARNFWIAHYFGQRRMPTADWILERMSDGDLVIVDLRKPEMFAKSHVRDAVNIAWNGSLGVEETWKSHAKFRGLYKSVGVKEDNDIVVYCQFGSMSAILTSP